MKKFKSNACTSMVMTKFIIIPVIVLLFLPALGAAIPDPYYVNVSWNDHTVQGVKDLLGGGFVEPYKFGTFDCTEMSSYVEWLLKCRGFDTRLCFNWMGPWAADPHAWVGVKLENEVIYIETTSKPPRIIQYLSSDWGKYNLPVDTVNELGMHQYADIYEAYDDGVQEIELDWWQKI